MPCSRAAFSDDAATFNVTQPAGTFPPTLPTWLSASFDDDEDVAARTTTTAITPTMTATTSGPRLRAAIGSASRRRPPPVTRPLRAAAPVPALDPGRS